MQEVNERLKLYNLRIDHVGIQWELKYRIGANIVSWNCWVSGGKTGPFPMARDFHVAIPDATVQFGVEPEPEPTREYGPAANPTRGWRLGF